MADLDFHTFYITTTGNGEPKRESTSDVEMAIEIANLFSRQLEKSGAGPGEYVFIEISFSTGWKTPNIYKNSRFFYTRTDEMATLIENWYSFHMMGVLDEQAEEVDKEIEALKEKRAAIMERRAQFCDHQYYNANRDGVYTMRYKEAERARKAAAEAAATAE